MPELRSEVLRHLQVKQGQKTKAKAKLNKQRNLLLQGHSAKRGTESEGILLKCKNTVADILWEGVWQLAEGNDGLYKTCDATVRLLG